MRNVSSTTFGNQNLDGRNFANQCLIGVRFSHCSVRRCDFSGTDLSYAVFEECDLYETKFIGAVLYFCRIFDCDATKADFSQALLNGIRVRDTDITHTEFGVGFRIGKNRKSIQLNQATENFLSVVSGDHIADVDTIESYDGIVCKNTGRAIRFIDDPRDEEWRTWRRRSEVAKTVERLLVENGYKDRSLDAYYLFRYYNTRAERNVLRKWIGLLLLEKMWGYGVRIAPPIITWVIIAIMFFLIYASIPSWDASGGLTTSGSPIEVFKNKKICWPCVSDLVVFSFQVSSLSVYGDVMPIGIAKWVALFHQLVSVVMVGFGIATITRRIGNI